MTLLMVVSLLPIGVGYAHVTPWVIPFLGYGMYKSWHMLNPSFLDSLQEGERVGFIIRSQLIYIAVAALLYAAGYGAALLIDVPLI